ncbi:MAG: CBS domain-containing protein [Pararhizobium sp.]
MTVKRILEEKGRDVVTIAARATLADAVQLLSERRIGALVVIDSDRTIRGIISERDIVRAIAARGASAMEGSVAGTMTERVTVCGEDHTVDQLMEIMTNGRFRHIPVEKEGRLVGIVSIGDVVRKRIEAVEREAEEMKAYITS